VGSVVVVFVVDAVLLVVVVVVLVVLEAAAVIQRFVYMKISRKNMKLVKKLAGISAEEFSLLDYDDVTSCTDTVTVNKYISEVNKERNAIKTHTVHCIALLHFAVLSGSSAARHLLNPSVAACQALLCMVHGLIIKCVL
jgi:hypothetical protein